MFVLYQEIEPSFLEKYGLDANTQYMADDKTLPLFVPSVPVMFQFYSIYFFSYDTEILQMLGSRS